MTTLAQWEKLWKANESALAKWDRDRDAYLVKRKARADEWRSRHRKGPIPDHLAGNTLTKTMYRRHSALVSQQTVLVNRNFHECPLLGAKRT